VANGSASDLSL
jgi:hypothetical protein